MKNNLQPSCTPSIKNPLWVGISRFMSDIAQLRCNLQLTYRVARYGCTPKPNGKKTSQK
jgi:hypothetical protein